MSATGAGPAPVGACPGGGPYCERPDFQVDPRSTTRWRGSARTGERRRDGSTWRARDPAEAILAVARETGADLIVVGNKGMHGRVLSSIPNSVSHKRRL